MRTLIITTATLILSTILAAACSEGFQPAEGTWEVEGTQIERDECNLGAIDGEEGPAPLELTLDEAGHILLNADLDDDDIPDFTCDLEAQKLVCSSWEDTFDDEDEAVAITIYHVVGGTFVDEETLDGEGRLGFDCTGSPDDCAAYAEAMEFDGFPCETTFTFSATHVGE